jgi:hypothetical protein
MAGAVRGRFGIGDGQVREVARLEHGASRIDVVGLGRPQHETADGVGKAAFGDGMAFCFQPRRRFVIGRQQHLERRTVADLRIEFAGGAVRQDSLVARVFLKLRGQLFHRAGEIGGHRHLDFASMGRSQASHHGKHTGKEFHVVLES